MSRPTLTLLSRPGCHLCDDARAVLTRVAGELGLVLEERDVTAEPADFARYGDWVPVTLVDGEEHAVFRVDEQDLRRRLAP